MKRSVASAGALVEAPIGNSRVLEYHDPVEAFRGFCVYDRDESRLAAGGCRVQHGLTETTLQALAATMTLKERVLGLGVDGAKCGIDYDPHSPGKAAALGRFLGFLRDELETRLSMGCDVGTRWHELERIAAGIGVRSVKGSIQQAQELTEHDFTTRLSVLDEHLGMLTLGERRAGHALAVAAEAAARHAQLGVGFVCSLQGFGNLGRAAAQTLADDGVRVVAVANEYGCVAKASGLDVNYLLQRDPYAPLPTEPGAASAPRERLTTFASDVCILAAGEDGIRLEDVAAVAAPVVVVGANGGLQADVERALARRGILVVPDLIGGVGGPASMEALFGPEHPPAPVDVLSAVRGCIDALVDDVLCSARLGSVPPREVAEAIAATTESSRGRRPYGHSPYFGRHRGGGRR